jgi:hypothetical protein
MWISCIGLEDIFQFVIRLRVIVELILIFFNPIYFTKIKKLL